GRERFAQALRRIGEVRKWRELGKLRAEIFTPAGAPGRVGEPESAYGAGNLPRPIPSPRQKLIIFTEHRDTLNYLEGRIAKVLGRQEGVVVVHGGMGREERMKAQEAFRHDPEVQVLVATDDAGAGVHRQRARLLVHDDPPSP